jgi:hypothetical protein
MKKPEEKAMSLYNMMCGNNPLYVLLHAIIDTAGELPEIPRYRDTWIRMDGGEPFVVIHTRTGGGNREAYTEQNAAIAEHPLYCGDCDDDFDSTFANFTFAVPEEWRDRVSRLHGLLNGLPNFAPAREKFDRAMASMSGQATEQPIVSEQTADEVSKLVAEMAIELGLVEGAT